MACTGRATREGIALSIAGGLNRCARPGRYGILPRMRTFEIRPVEQERDAHDLWVLVAMEDDGTEVVAGEYQTMAEAEEAKVALEQGDVDIRS